MNEWQPIETAPKDGRWVLVFIPEAYNWHYGERHCAKWVSRESGWSMPGIGGLSPTHWMPLPEPPK